MLYPGEWVESWLCLSGRQLVYSTEDSAMPFEHIDLKRTKDVFLRKDSKNLDLPADFAKHPVLVCDFNDRYLHCVGFHNFEKGVTELSFGLVRFP